MLGILIPLILPDKSGFSLHGRRNQKGAGEIEFFKNKSGRTDKRSLIKEVR
jgi:hypothetical protein